MTPYSRGRRSVQRASRQFSVRMMEDSRTALKRVVERRARARHYRDVERLSLQEIGRRLGRAPATIKAYLYARLTGARLLGGGARNGKGDAYPYCKVVPAGRGHTEAVPRVGARGHGRLAAADGRPPSSTEWSPPHARRIREALERLADRDWPPASTVIDLYGN